MCASHIPIGAQDFPLIKSHAIGMEVGAIRNP